MRAAGFKSEDSVGALNALVAAGAPLNETDVEGSTPLHHAARAGYIEAVDVLIAGGADVGLKNAKGHTPLDEAELGKHSETAVRINLAVKAHNE